MPSHPLDPTRRGALQALSATLCAAALPSLATAQAAPPPLKVAFVYAGPVGEAGWSFSHEAARLAVAREFGARIATTAVPSVREGPEAERVLRDLVAQGHRLIFATSFGYMDAALRVAADHPEVRIEHATGYKTAPNLRTFDARSYEPAYLAGLVAGAMTRSQVLGVVGAMPTPEVLRVINALTLGARAANPAATVRVLWVNEWLNPPKETEAAQALVNQGADVLMQTTDSPAVVQVAERLGKFGFGLCSDMSAFGRNAHLGSMVLQWSPYVARSIREVLEGRWATGQTWWGMKEGIVDLVGVPDKVPATVRTRLDSVRRGLRDGSFKIWQGPIADSTGKTVVAAGQAGDDAWLHRMQFYVQGVEGRVPNGR